MEQLAKSARRLAGTHAYAAVFAAKCCATGECFQVYANPNGIESARLGVVVSKRIMSRAVDRNYCKRLVREVFRYEGAALRGFDFVVRLRREIIIPTPKAVRVELRDLLLRGSQKCRRQNFRPATPDHG